MCVYIWLSVKGRAERVYSGGLHTLSPLPHFLLLQQTVSLSLCVCVCVRARACVTGKRENVCAGTVCVFIHTHIHDLVS